VKAADISGIKKKDYLKEGLMSLERAERTRTSETYIEGINEFQCAYQYRCKLLKD
jgi:hypothetical protein